ncbi:MAG: hypothetical protein JOZ14_17100 [Acidobacteria bacterium]|nr:hypothetical protein [Acidobacteriota bacterium]
MWVAAGLGLACALLAAPRPGGFAVLGPGGGGAMFHPTISPLDRNTVLVSSDMTGAYITHDGGSSWRMFNLRGEVQFFVFDPTDPKTMYAGTKALWRTIDAGETWQLVYPPSDAVRAVRMNGDHAGETIVARPDPLGTIVALAVDPEDHRVLYAVAVRDEVVGLHMSRDSGRSWQELDPLPESARKIWIDPHSSRRRRNLFVAGAHTVLLDSPAGARRLSVPPDLTGVAMGFAGNGQPLIYAASGRGLFISRDGGFRWEKSDLPGDGARLRALAASFEHAETAYVSYEHLLERGFWSYFEDPGRKQWRGVAKTVDGGRNWQLVWRESNLPAENVHDGWISQRFGPGWAGNPLDLVVAAQDQNLAYATDFGRVLRTADGGRNWMALYCRKVPGAQWSTTGLDVTTSYGIHFDPFDPKRQFITYTDIGLFRSEDGGRSWESSTAGVPQAWVNTAYWVTFDPQVRGRMWSANSGTHDLPRPKMWRHGSIIDFKGGVCRSDDGGKTWVRSSSGMEESASTHILLEQASPPDARVLYVTAFGRGVYKSRDGGRSWTLRNKGIAQSQPLAWRLAEDSSGMLYVLIARRSDDGSIGNDGDGALYRSRDGAENWEAISLPAGVNGPSGLAIDPQAPNRIYLSAWARATGTHGDGGGIFLSEDAGRSWRPVLERDRHVYDVSIDPEDSRRLYAAGFESSAWISRDRGRQWSRIPGFNFKWGHRVIADPLDPRLVYVTTFGGGVWHGSINARAEALDIVTPQLEPGHETFR